MKIYRNFEINLDTRDDEKRTVEASVSSEAPVERWDGTEILSHDPSAIDLSRAPLPLLTSHDGNQTPVGIVENLRAVGGKLRGVLRFGNSTRASEAWADVKAGILRNLSIGYQVLKKQIEADGDAYRAVKWMPYEVSLVSIPADITVGIGRNHSFESEETMTIEKSESKRPRELKRQAERETREEIQEIIAIGERLGLQKEANQFISEGGRLEQFRTFAMDAMEKRSGQPPRQTFTEIGMSRREVGRYSMVNVLRCLAFPNEQKFRQAAGFELECSDAAAKASPVETRGIRIPIDVNQNWQTRTLTAGTATDGAELVGTNLLAGSFIDVLRNLSICLNLGATTLEGLVGNIAIPRKTSGATAAWLATEGADVGNSEPQFDQVTLTPKTLGCYADMTRNLLLQSTPAIENLVRSDLAEAVATAIDKAGLYGTGANGQPKGISEQTGINAPTAFAAAIPTWAEVVAMESAVAVDNALAGRLGYCIEPAMCGSLKTTAKETGYPSYIMESNDKLNGHRAAVSSQVTAGDMFFGNWADLIFGFWGGLDLLTDPYTLGRSGGIRIVIHQSCDIGVRHPVSFAYNNDGA